MSEWCDLKDIVTRVVKGKLRWFGLVRAKESRLTKQIYRSTSEPHSTDIVFGRRRTRTSLAQIVSQISAITFEIVKSVINSAKRWSFIIKGQPKSVITLVGLNGNDIHRKS
ncbi:hypothetical protein EVAR_33209_1 [Eumeta japonica]|uniref:Uncharacterized protein n=1 Tax=Eumeta variegata TaxID=151549 RepID=A0A4C1W4K2_EUMVA|nr:hypothetical protein EVAR_33209_1 [Eumeta japonica]